MRKVFISHSEKDSRYVDLLVKLLRKVGLNNDEIFYSSDPRTGIGLAKDIIDELDYAFKNDDLFVIIIHSKNYYKSSICLNEMGAAWTRDFENASILLPGFEFNEMDGVINNSLISIKMDHKKEEVTNLTSQLLTKIIKKLEKEEFEKSKGKRLIDEFIDGVLSEYNSKNQNMIKVYKRRLF